MQLLQHFKELTVRPENSQKVKGLILQLAVQGKLTANWREENPNFESESEILKRIEEEKKQLIKEKKLKKEKPFSPITKDEIPYPLPEGWVWCRLADISIYIQRGKSPKYSDVKLYPVIAQKCIQWKEFEIYKAKFIDPKTIDKYGPERILKTDDLLWNSTGRGSLGRIALYNENYNEYELAVADSHVTVIRVDKDNCMAEYAFDYLSSPIIQDNIESRSTGSTNQIELGTGTVKETIFPLPPLQEQKEIVRVVEALFKEVEQLEQLTVQRIGLKEDFVTSALHQLTTNNANQEWSFLQDHFKSFFNETTNIKKLRETVLQLAVQGKLTADWRQQRSLSGAEVEDASQLLKRIQVEKAQLIKDKKIKKEKALPPIGKDEIPYELPAGWVWCRLGDILLSTDAGKSPSCEKRPVEKDEWGVLTTTSIQKGYFLQGENKVLPSSFEINHSMDVQEGDILITRAGPLNRTGIVCRVKELSYNLILSDKTVRLKHFADNVNGDFLVVILNSSIIRELLVAMMSGMASSQVNISQGNIKLSMIPLPPLEEQKAIVEKVNALMGLCDALEQEVKQSQAQSEMLMQSCLREVFEGRKAVNKI